MAYTLDDVLEGLRGSRTFFLRHLDELRDEQWDWKPYPECKSIRETLAHMIGNDAAALQSLQTGKAPDYDAILTGAAQDASDDYRRLRARLEESFNRLCDFIQSTYAGAPLDTEVCIYGSMMKLGRGVAYLSSEDYYHAGQVGFIRIATDPTWDYYGFIYGG